MRNALSNNIGFKLLALLLAIIAWAYVVMELEKGATEEQETLQRILPYRLISRKLPIDLNIVGEPQEGYRILAEGIIIEPSEFIMLAPRAVMGRLISLKTQEIDITGATKNIVKDVSIIPPAQGVIKEKFVSVTIPIVKVK